MNIFERVLLLKAFSDHLSTVKRETDAEARALFEPGDRKAVRRDGVKIGTLTLSDPKPAWKVTDRAAFTAWVQDNYPDAVVHEPRVVPAWEKEFLANPVTVDGEVPAGVEPGSASPAFTIKPDPGALQALAGELPGLLEVEQ